MGGRWRQLFGGKMKVLTMQHRVRHEAGKHHSKHHKD